MRVNIPLHRTDKHHHCSKRKHYSLVVKCSVSLGVVFLPSNPADVCFQCPLLLFPLGGWFSWPCLQNKSPPGTEWEVEMIEDDLKYQNATIDRNLILFPTLFSYKQPLQSQWDCIVQTMITCQQNGVKPQRLLQMLVCPTV